MFEWHVISMVMPIYVFDCFLHVTVILTVGGESVYFYIYIRPYIRPYIWALYIYIGPWELGSCWWRWGGGAGEGGMKIGGSVLLEASGCSEDLVSGKTTPVGFLLFSWEGRFEAALRWEEGLKGTFGCSNLMEKEAGFKTGPFFLGRRWLLLVLLHEMGCVEVVSYVMMNNSKAASCLPRQLCWLQKGRLQAEIIWWICQKNGCLAALVTSWNAALSIWDFRSKGETIASHEQCLLEVQKCLSLNISLTFGFQSYRISPSQFGKLGGALQALQSSLDSNCIFDLLMPAV